MMKKIDRNILRFGKIQYIRVGGKKKSAILQFFNASSATLAFEHFSTDNTMKKQTHLKVILKTKKSSSGLKNNSDTITSAATTTTNVKERGTKDPSNESATNSIYNGASLTYEQDVLARLQKAAGI